jgi:hypothetical protein
MADYHQPSLEYPFDAGYDEPSEQHCGTSDEPWERCSDLPVADSGVDLDTAHEGAACIPLLMDTEGHMDRVEEPG